MNYLKHGVSQSAQKDEAQEMLRSQVPISERPRASYGSLLMSLQMAGGLCASRRCVRKANHDGDHWPKEN